MEYPTSPSNTHHLKSALSIFTLFYAITALPVSAQTISGGAYSHPPVPPSWSILEDADQDGMTDIDEILWGMDPLNPADGLSELDGDGLSLAWEFYIGTNPDVSDTDADDWSDSEEYLLYGTDPLDSLNFPLSGAPASVGENGLVSSPPAPEVVMATSVPPSLSGGDFSGVTFSAWKNMMASKDYQNRGFMWGAGKVPSWEPYTGGTIEVWDAGSGEKFVELDGSPGNYGIKQVIEHPQKGGYVLTWKDCGRNNTNADDNPYCLRVYYMDGDKESVIIQPPDFTNLKKDQWTDRAIGFQITPKQLADAKGAIYVAFIPTGRLNTYGTLIDKVSLISVEVVDKGGISANELNVADMENSLTELGKVILDPDVTDGYTGDPDRFYVRLLGLGDGHTVSVKLSTVDNPDTIYNDDPTELKLYPEAGGYKSKSQLLVSGAIDAEIETLENIVLPDTPNPTSQHKRTHNVQLGGNVKIADLVIDGKPLPIELKIPVPVKKTVKLNVVIIDDAGKPDIAAELKSANERFASAGVRVELAAPAAPATPLPALAIDANGKLVEGEAMSSVATGDVRDYGRYISNYGTLSTIDDIHVFYVKQCVAAIDARVPSQGTAIMERTAGTSISNPLLTADKTGYANNIFLSENRALYKALAHELCHVLTNAGHYGMGQYSGTFDYDANAPSPKPAHNLVNATRPNYHTEKETTTTRKRIYESQRLMLLPHRSLK